MKILTKLVLELHAAFPRVCRLHNKKSRICKNWANLFERLDTDGSGRLDFEEFKRAVKHELQVKVPPGTLKALWNYVDYDESDEANIFEFQHARRRAAKIPLVVQRGFLDARPRDFVQFRATSGRESAPLRCPRAASSTASPTSSSRRPAASCTT